MRVATYNENTTRAGEWVGEETIAEYELQHGTAECGDWTLHEGSKADILEQARLHETYAIPGASGQHDRKVAASLRDAVEFA